MSTAPTVVIGASRAELIPALVCESSIKRHCPDANVIQVYDRPDRPTRGLIQHGGKDPTNFSFVRFWLPELCGRKGRAIYLDCDMILFADIAELFDTPMGDKWVLHTPNPSVLLVDCEHTPWYVRDMISWVDDDAAESRYRYGTNMMTLGRIPKERVGGLPPWWNHLDVYQAGSTKLLHYTNMQTQPWVNHLHEASVPAHRLAGLWYSELALAVDSGYLGIESVPECMRSRLEDARNKTPTHAN